MVCMIRSKGAGPGLLLAAGSIGMIFVEVAGLIMVGSLGFKWILRVPSLIWLMIGLSPGLILGLLISAGCWLLSLVGLKAVTVFGVMVGPVAVHAPKVWLFPDSSLLFMSLNHLVYLLFSVMGFSLLLQITVPGFLEERTMFHKSQMLVILKGGLVGMCHCLV